jgi:hypothetical protein
MAKDKKIVNFYVDWLNTYELLSDEEAGLLIKHKLRYLNDLDPEPPNRVIEVLFVPFKQIFKRDLRKWNDKIKSNSIAGKASAAKRAKNKNETKKEVNTVKEDNINNNNYSKICLNDKQWLDITSMQNKGKNIIELLSKFDKHLITISEQKRDIKQYKQHFINWLAKQPKGSASKINLGI